MHPVPETSLYPQPTGTMKGRPWWSSRPVAGDGYYNQGEAEGWFRRDGWEILDNGYLHYANHIDHPDMNLEGVRPDVIARRIDQLFPLPAPELRAGQVWLVSEHKGQFVELAVLNTHLIHNMNAALEFIHSKTRLYDLAGLGLKANETQRLLLQGGSRTMRFHLVHDPVYPAAAPWTSYLETSDVVGPV